MGFLGRLMKNTVEEKGEEQDEFAAEENGLLMVPSLPGEHAEPATAEGVGAQPVASGADPLDLAGASSAVQGQPEPIPGQEPQAEQGSSNEAMDLFRTDAVREDLLSPVLMDSIEDVSVTDLLAEARSIRDGLSGGRSGAGEREQEAA